VRLAIPRRVYTQSHMAVVADTVAAVLRRQETIAGLRMTHEAAVLRHFTARFEPLEAVRASQS